MKLCFLIRDLSSIGGTERVTTHVASLLSRSDQVCILSLEGSGTSAFPVSSSVEVVWVSADPRSLLRRFRYSSPMVRSWLIERDFDALVCSDTQLAPIALMATSATRTKLIVWEHFNCLAETTFGSRWFGRRIAALFADCIVTLTEQDRQAWSAKYPMRARSAVIPNPSSIAVQCGPYLDASRTVLAAGRFTDQKGFDLLVKAWSLIDERVREGWRLRIVGPNGSHKEVVRKLVSQHRLHDSIDLAGPSGDMLAEYRSASFFVSSSRYEGFGLTIIEAMSCGLPVVAFDCPMGPGEILADRYGLLVEPANIESLASALAALMSSNTLRRHYNKASLERARSYEEGLIMERWQMILASPGDSNDIH